VTGARTSHSRPPTARSMPIPTHRQSSVTTHNAATATAPSLPAVAADPAPPHEGRTRPASRERRNIGMADAAPLLAPGEVALMFRVDPRTVTRWANDGRLGCIRTLGGHRRFLESEVTALLFDETGPAPAQRL